MNTIEPRIASTITDYHASYYAHKLTLEGGTGVNKLSQSLMNSAVDLNPHQVEGALFALRSPFSKGVILADEVGLGKTIEAGLVLSQLWAEGKRNILILAPAALRKQWQIELEDKFALPSVIIDGPAYNRAKKEGFLNPFDQDKIILSSYHFVSGRANDVRLVDWDISVFDEAHKLRNSYRESNKLGANIKWSLEDRKKLLLTATPFQNNLLELYGLCSLIDPQMFGELATFRTLYTKIDGDLGDLRSRLKPMCHRTLRKDVLEFIRYTQRIVETIEYEPSQQEHRLYIAVNAFLQREDSYAVPAKQRHLTSIVLRKMLASSPVALASTLSKVLNRLERLKDDPRALQAKPFDFEDDDFDEELLEEFEERNEEELELIDIVQLQEEIDEVKEYIEWANSIVEDSKTEHLNQALEIGYKKMATFGGARKAVIFTESRKTQAYLEEYLEHNGHRGKVVCFSGADSSPETKEIVKNWKVKYPDRVTGSAAIDKRQAIVDHFKDSAEILLATEAAAEGINLQFCSLLINYDLPWNPQRVEQRIGRVHRYGQQHDVVVINFINKKNRADQRVYELLSHKFHLFEGVMGASDEVLGNLQSAANFDQKINEILNRCRKESEIDDAFDELQKEMESQINEKMIKTREKVLEHFDEDVHNLLKIDYDETLKLLDEDNRQFWNITKHILSDFASFNEDNLSFHLKQTPISTSPIGKYWLNRKRDTRLSEDELTHEFELPSDARLYRMSHPLGEYCLNTCKSKVLSSGNIQFSLSAYEHKISALDEFIGRRGVLLLQKVVIESAAKDEFLLFSASTLEGESLSPDLVEKMFRLPGEVTQAINFADGALHKVRADATVHKDAKVKKVLEENNKHFKERQDAIYRWAEDVVAAAEKQIADVKAEIRKAEREARDAITTEEQLECELKLKELAKKKRQARKNSFDVEDRVEVERDQHIKSLESKMTQNVTQQELFCVGWEIV